MKLLPYYVSDIHILTVTIKTLSTITKEKDVSNSKAHNSRSSQSPSSSLRSSSRIQRKSKHSQGVGQYMGRVEVASTAKTTVS